MPGPNSHSRALRTFTTVSFATAAPNRGSAASHIRGTGSLLRTNARTPLSRPARSRTFASAPSVRDDRSSLSSSSIDPVPDPPATVDVPSSTSPADPCGVPPDRLLSLTAPGTPSPSPFTPAAVISAPIQSDPAAACVGEAIGQSNVLPVKR
eukprot:31062-Pelagococcus_subviridis.AAC.8